MPTHNYNALSSDSRALLARVDSDFAANKQWLNLSGKRAAAGANPTIAAELDALPEKQLRTLVGGDSLVSPAAWSLGQRKFGWHDTDSGLWGGFKDAFLNPAVLAAAGGYFFSPAGAASAGDSAASAASVDSAGDLAAASDAGTLYAPTHVAVADASGLGTVLKGAGVTLGEGAKVGSTLVGLAAGVKGLTNRTAQPVGQLAPGDFTSGGSGQGGGLGGRSGPSSSQGVYLAVAAAVLLAVMVLMTGR